MAYLQLLIALPDGFWGFLCFHADGVEGARCVLPFCSQLLAQTIGNGASGTAFDVLVLQVVQQTAVLAANILSFRARM